MKNEKYFVLAKLAVAALSFIAVWSLPYSYYQFLRVFIFIIGCYLAYRAYEREKEVSFWVIAYGITAILFNPIFPIHMAKESWTAINLATGFFYLISLENGENMSELEKFQNENTSEKQTRVCSTVYLTHHLKRKPTEEEIEAEFQKRSQKLEEIHKKAIDKKIQFSEVSKEADKVLYRER